MPQQSHAIARRKPIVPSFSEALKTIARWSLHTLKLCYLTGSLNVRQWEQRPRTEFPLLGVSGRSLNSPQTAVAPKE